MILNQNKATLSRELKNKKRPVSANRKKLYTSNTTNTLQSLLNRRIANPTDINLNALQECNGEDKGLNGQHERKKVSTGSEESTEPSWDKNINLQKSDSIKNLQDIQQESLLTIKLDKIMSMTKDEYNNNQKSNNDARYSVHKKFNTRNSPMKDNNEDLDEVIEGNYEVNEQDYNLEEFESHI